MFWPLSGTKTVLSFYAVSCHLIQIIRQRKMLQITALLVLFYVKLALLSHILGILQQETTSQIETRRKRGPKESWRQETRR